MRAHYVRALRAARERGLTQKKVAAAGGLKGQNYVSKIKSAGRLGPAVEIFIRAIEGLGMHPSDFFAELEGRPAREHPAMDAMPGAPGLEKSFIVDTVIETLQRGVTAPAPTSQSRRRNRG